MRDGFATFIFPVAVGVVVTLAVQHIWSWCRREWAKERDVETVREFQRARVGLRRVQ